MIVECMAGVLGAEVIDPEDFNMDTINDYDLIPIHFLSFFGGMNKGRPNDKALNQAKLFAESLLK